MQTIIPLGHGKWRAASDHGAVLHAVRALNPAEGITPDIEVSQQIPQDLQARNVAISEAALRGHLKASGAEEKGSQTYVPADPSR